MDKKSKSKYITDEACIIEIQNIFNAEEFSLKHLRNTIDRLLTYNEGVAVAKPKNYINQNLLNKQIALQLRAIKELKVVTESFEELFKYLEKKYYDKDFKLKLLPYEETLWK